MRYFIRFAYDGTAFHGSQRQPNGITVQETMEQALAMIFREEVPLTFAGRTDAGVHAREMFAHFDIEASPKSSPEGKDFTAADNNSLPSGRVGVGFYIEMRIHLAGMDACIGATSKSERYLLTENHSQRLLHCFLNSNAIGLAL